MRYCKSIAGLYHLVVRIVRRSFVPRSGFV